MITKYISYLRDIRNYSENTLIGYEKDLRAFSKWAKAHLNHARWSEITRSDIDQYVHAMVATGMKPSSTNRRLSAISGLYEYFKREGYEVENPCKYESRRKVSKNLPNTINEEELRAAYENATGATKTIIGFLVAGFFEFVFHGSFLLSRVMELRFYLFSNIRSLALAERRFVASSSSVGTIGFRLTRVNSGSSI